VVYLRCLSLKAIRKGKIEADQVPEDIFRYGWIHCNIYSSILDGGRAWES